MLTLEQTITLVAVVDGADASLLSASYHAFEQAFKFSPKELGVLSMTQAMALTVVLPFWPPLISKYGYRKLLILSAIAWGFCTLITPMLVPATNGLLSSTIIMSGSLVPSWTNSRIFGNHQTAASIPTSTWLTIHVILRAINGAALSGIVPISQAMLGDIVPSHRLGAAFGKMGAWQGIARLILNYFLLSSDNPFFYWYVVVFFTVILIGILKISIPKELGMDKNTNNTNNNFFRIIKKVICIKSFMVLVVQGIAGGTPWHAMGFVNLYLLNLGFTNSEVAIISTVCQLGGIPGSLIGGYLGDFMARFWAFFMNWVLDFFCGLVGLDTFKAGTATGMKSLMKKNFEDRRKSNVSIPTKSNPLGRILAVQISVFGGIPLWLWFYNIRVFDLSKYSGNNSNVISATYSIEADKLGSTAGGVGSTSGRGTGSSSGGGTVSTVIGSSPGTVSTVIGGGTGSVERSRKKAHNSLAQRTEKHSLLEKSAQEKENSLSETTQAQQQHGGTNMEIRRLFDQNIIHAIPQLEGSTGKEAESLLQTDRNVVRKPNINDVVKSSVKNTDSSTVKSSVKNTDSSIGDNKVVPPSKDPDSKPSASSSSSLESKILDPSQIKIPTLGLFPDSKFNGVVGFCIVGFLFTMVAVAGPVGTNRPLCTHLVTDPTERAQVVSMWILVEGSLASVFGGPLAGTLSEHFGYKLDESKIGNVGKLDRNMLNQPGETSVKAEISLTEAQNATAMGLALRNLGWICWTVCGCLWFLMYKTLPKDVERAENEALARSGSNPLGYQGNLHAYSIPSVSSPNLSSSEYYSQNSPALRHHFDASRHYKESIDLLQATVGNGVVHHMEDQELLGNDNYMEDKRQQNSMGNQRSDDNEMTSTVDDHDKYFVGNQSLNQREYSQEYSHYYDTQNKDFESKGTVQEKRTLLGSKCNREDDEFLDEFLDPDEV